MPPPAPSTASLPPAANRPQPPLPSLPLQAVHKQALTGDLLLDARTEEGQDLAELSAAICFLQVRCWRGAMGAVLLPVHAFWGHTTHKWGSSAIVCCRRCLRDGRQPCLARHPHPERRLLPSILSATCLFLLCRMNGTIRWMTS